jgi:hypothetical protein
MTTTSHPVAPEDVMAFFDGELSAAGAQAVSAHLALCAECSRLAEQLRVASQSISRWIAPAVPKKLEDTMKNLTAKTLPGPKAGKADSSMRINFWNWRLWAIGGGGALVAVLALVIFAIAMTSYENHREVMLSRSSGLAAIDDRAETRIPAGKPRAMNALEAPPPPSAAKGLAGGGGESRDHAASSAAPAPMIARTVSLTIVVKDFAAARASLDNILARHHGYAAQLTVSTPENAARSFQASLRVPAPELSSALGDFKALGSVENESQSGEEVTQQHTDLVQRLKTARDTEERFRAILQQRTGKLEEVLEVEEQIARVRGEIEGMEAELKTLEHRVDFATVDLQLIEEYSARLSSPSASVSNRMHNAFIAGLSNAAATLLGIVLFLEEYGPVLLIWLVILGVPIVLIWRRYRRMRAKV